MIDTIAVAVLALAAIPILLGISLKDPKLPALALLAVLVFSASSSWGQLTVENTIYSRGVGQLNFSLINIFLFVAACGVLVRRLTDPFYTPVAPSIASYLWLFGFLIVAHALVGMVSGISLDVSLGYSGIINVLNMLMFMFLAIAAFREPKDRDRLLFAFLVFAVARGIFGLVRYKWFGGDASNPYGNFEGLDIKLVFFDIADNFVASLAAFICAWLLTSPHVRLALPTKLALLAILGIEIATVIFSFRRTALLGLGMMFLFMMFRLPPKRRVVIMLLAAGVVVAGAVVFFQQRFQYAGDGHSSIIGGLTSDVSSGDIESEGRFYELYAAAKSVGNNWLFGLGTWGTFTGDRVLLSYHGDRFDFIHSGFGHIIMKTGVVGLAIFLGLLYQCLRMYFRYWKILPGYARLMADAGFAGFLFWLPDLLVGTPVIEFRTMLLIGFTLALPFIAVGVAAYRSAHHYYYAVA